MCERTNDNKKLKVKKSKLKAKLIQKLTQN